LDKKKGGGGMVGGWGGTNDGFSMREECEKKGEQPGLWGRGKKNPRPRGQIRWVVICA